MHHVDLGDGDREVTTIAATKTRASPPFKHDFAGYRSRRITGEHRLVYKITETEVRIAACRYHYRH